MNRQQRRRAKASDDRAASGAGIAAVVQEAAGMLDVLTFARGDLVPMMVAAALGSLEAVAMLRAVKETIEHITHAPPSTPALCGCCDREIRGTAFLIVVAAPMGKPLARSQVLCTTLCPRCKADIPANALKALQRVWPEARHITIHPGTAVMQ